MFTEDLSVFFNTSHFGESFTFGAVTFDGVWMEDYEDASGIQGSMPAILATTASVASVAIAASGTHGATTYKVRVKKPDGTGLTVLQLEEQ